MAFQCFSAIGHTTTNAASGDSNPGCHIQKITSKNDREGGKRL